MARAKPTHVIIHRIELQEKEREYLEQVVAGQTVKNIVVPVAIGAGVGAAGYLGYKALNAAYEWGDDVVDDLKREYTEHKEKVATVAKASGVAAERMPGPIGNFYRVGKWLIS